LGGSRDRKFVEVREVGRFGRILSPVMDVFLQLNIHCVSYSGHYRAQRLVHSINVVLHVA
jgi:hypothetical protein